MVLLDKLEWRIVRLDVHSRVAFLEVWPTQLQIPAIPFKVPVTA